MKKNLLKILSLVLAVAFSTMAQATPTATPYSQSTSSSVNSSATIDITTFTASGTFGIQKVLVGDFDCDTYEDIVFAAPSYSPSESEDTYGAVYIVSGSSSVSGGSIQSIADYEIVGTYDYETLGADIVKISDLSSDGDGCPELAVLSTPGGTGAETVYLFKSSTITGWHTNGVSSVTPETGSDSKLSLSSHSSYHNLHSVGAIDTNVTNEDYLALCSNTINTCQFFPSTAFQNHSYSNFGTINNYVEFTVGAAGIHESVAHGDLNADGEEDLILGAYAQSTPGVLIFYGPISNSFTSNGNGNTFDSNNDFDLVDENGNPTGNTPSDRNLWIEEESHSNQSSSSRSANDGDFGAYVGVIDVDNDGQDELIVGYPYDFNSSYGTYYILTGFDAVSGNPNQGTSAITNVVYTGTTDGTYNFGNAPLEVIEYHGANSHTVIGFAGNAAVGNFNGDDYADLALGGESGEGEQNILYGGLLRSQFSAYNSISPIALDSSNIQGYIEADLANQNSSGAEILDQLGTSNAVGDLDGDGLDELVVLATGAGSQTYGYADTEVYVFKFPNNHNTDGDEDYSNVAQGVDQGDCNDMDPSVYLQTWYLDADGDGYGDANTSVESCEQPTGYVDYDPNVDEFDCDDTDATINPDTVWYYDFDLDGYGDSSQSTVTCQQPRSSIGTHVLNDSDCDDRDSTINPDTVWYLDSDGDGYGDANTTTTQCSQPTNYVLDDTDCNDADANLNSETLWYLDSDGDGFGNPDATVASCEQPTGYLVDDTDCDDSRAAINPNTVWYEDADHDGYGNPDHSIQSCEMPTGYVLQGTDINDSESSVYPGAPEICDDNIDNDSDGLTDGQDQVDCNDFDYDDDGYSSLDGDCDDENPVVYPGARELADAIDNDCDGLLDDGLMNVGASIIGNNTIHAGENFEIRLSLDNLTGLENFKIQVLLPDSPDSNFTRYVKTVANQFPTSRNLGILNQNGGGLRNDMCANDNCKVVSEMEVTLRAAQDEEFTLVSNVPADFVAGHYPLRVRIIDTDTNQVVGWLNNFFLNTPASEIIYIRVQDR